MASTRREAEGENELESGGPVWQETQVSAIPTKPSSSTSMGMMSYILRLIVIVLTLLAAIVMGVAKETVIVDVSADYTLEGETKSTYNSSFVYFIIVNTLACVYCAVSVGISFTNQNNSSIHLPLSIADLIVAILLFTGNASAAAIEIVAQKGNNHFGWTKICNYASKFCDHLTASIVLSTLASVICAVVLVLSMIRLQKKSH
ncbi:hypothetical protein IEQ34_009055 [Dendrobium chrysotoxum]|uniref:CASP-like protein n=1 Tax=Dendrobium chrysotoxum TaxID=161865 RepID=A0AAV7H1W2_DENCH|nr:hypothetical protein IEQ34_009055 [Dendrobium chrysotoxum]